MSVDDPLVALRERFKTRATTEADALEHALGGQDFDAVERIAHSLAGAAGLFGFAAISAQALGIDADFASGRPLDKGRVEELIFSLRACRDYS